MTDDILMPEHSDGLASELAPSVTSVVAAAAAFMPGVVLERGIRAPVEALCREARRRGLRIEQMLVVLKDAWWHHAALRNTPHSASTDGLARVVTLCIAEFFREDSGGYIRQEARRSERHRRAGDAHPGL
jgi:hypothetical protein